MSKLLVSTESKQRKGSFVVLTSNLQSNEKRKTSVVFGGILGRGLERTLSSFSNRLSGREKPREASATFNNPRYKSQRAREKQRPSKRMPKAVPMHKNAPPPLMRGRSSSLLLKMLPRKASYEEFPIEILQDDDATIPLPNVSSMSCCLNEEENHSQEIQSEPEEDIKSVDTMDKLVPDLQLVRFNSDRTLGSGRKKSSFIPKRNTVIAKPEDTI